jgi:hypothetical protein
MTATEQKGGESRVDSLTIFNGAVLVLFIALGVWWWIA